MNAKLQAMLARVEMLEYNAASMLRRFLKTGHADHGLDYHSIRNADWESSLARAEFNRALHQESEREARP